MSRAYAETRSVLALGCLAPLSPKSSSIECSAATGAALVSLVTYLLPVTALFYGVTLLGEPLTVEDLVGMALILGSVAFGSAAVRMPRREPAPVTPSH